MSSHKHGRELLVGIWLRFLWLLIYYKIYFYYEDIPKIVVPWCVLQSWMGQWVKVRWLQMICLFLSFTQLSHFWCRDGEPQGSGVPFHTGNTWTNYPMEGEGNVSWIITTLIYTVVIFVRIKYCPWPAAAFEAQFVFFVQVLNNKLWCRLDVPY